jgi:hypothetical protein
MRYDDPEMIRAKEILHQRKEREKRLKRTIYPKLAQTFNLAQRSREEVDEPESTGTKYDPDVGAYKPRSSVTDKKEVISHGPAEKHKRTPVGDLGEILRNAEAELADLKVAVETGDADPEEVAKKQKEVAELTEFVKRAQMPPKSTFDPGRSEIKVYGSKSRWTQRKFIFMVRVKMPDNHVHTYYPLANTHYYHGRLYYGTPPPGVVLGADAPKEKEEFIEGVLDQETGDIDIKGAAQRRVGSAIKIDDKNVIVVYPRLPKTPLEKFIESDKLMKTIKKVLISKRFNRALWAYTMIDYKAEYWKSLFGSRSPDVADQIFANFIMKHVEINHPRGDDIKLKLLARYMGLRSGYEIRDLKAYLAYDPESIPEEPELIAASVDKSGSSISEYVFSLEDE